MVFWTFTSYCKYVVSVENYVPQPSKNIIKCCKSCDSFVVVFEVVTIGVDSMVWKELTAWCC